MCFVCPCTRVFFSCCGFFLVFCFSFFLFILCFAKHLPHSMSPSPQPPPARQGPTNIFDPTSEPILNFVSAPGRQEPVNQETVSHYIYLVNMYKEYSWYVDLSFSPTPTFALTVPLPRIYYPLHPASFEEFNVSYFFTSSEGMKEVSSLSVNVYLAIAFGMHASLYPPSPFPP